MPHTPHTLRNRTLAISLCIGLSGTMFGQATRSAGTAATLKTDQPGAATLVPKRTISTDIRDGILTVDGLAVKADLNYDIQGAPYLYFFLPGIGTAVVARDRMPNSLPEKDGFLGSTLTIHAFGHVIELSNANVIAEKKKNETACVSLDNDFTRADHMPMVGFGNAMSAPYQWPAAKEMPRADQASGAPPLPPSALPRMESSTTATMPPVQGSAGKR